MATIYRRRSFVKYISMAWLVFAFATAVLAVETTSIQDGATSSNNMPTCTPSNCVAKCNPSCSSDQVCVLGTMTACGVCPTSSCISRSLLGGGSSGSDSGDSSSSGSDSSSDNNDGGSSSGAKDHGTLIGGVVGGLLAAGLVVSAAGYAGFRYRQKKQDTLPFAFHGKPKAHPQTDTGNSSSSNSRDMQQVPPTAPAPRQEVMSGVIPIAYVPPRDSVQTQESSLPRPISQEPPARTLEEQQQQYDHAVRTSTLYRFKQQQQQIHQQLAQSSNQPQQATSDNPFSDTHRLADDDDDDDDDDDRESVVQPSTATYQVMRARPQIMRVNTVRVQDRLTRQDSTRTILTKDGDNDDPFDDRNHTSTATTTTTASTENKPTDSIMSGDGEITIFWDGKTNSS